MTPVPSKTSRNQEAGFTLMELLVALSVAAVLFTLLSGGIKFSSAAWQALDNNNQSNREIQIAQSSIRRLVQKALPLSVKNSDQIEFEGSSDQVQFVVSNIARLDEPGLFKVQLGRQPSGLQDDFMVGWQRYSYQSQGLSQYESHQLLSQIKSLKFEYFGEVPGNSEIRKWHTSWKGRSSLPNLISVEVALPEDGSRRWPKQYISIETAPK